VLKLCKLNLGVFTQLKGKQNTKDLLDFSYNLFLSL